MANLDPNRLQNPNRYWQAANYLTLGQIHLQENPLLREPLRPEHIKPRLQWLDVDAAVKHCAAGATIWAWAGNEQAREPDVVLAAAGDIPALEVVAAAWLLRKHAPGLKVRVVNVMCAASSMRGRRRHPSTGSCATR